MAKTEERVYNTLLTKLILLRLRSGVYLSVLFATALFMGEFSTAFAQSESLVPDATKQQAIKIAQSIESGDLIVNATKTINVQEINGLDENTKLATLRQLTMDAAFFRNQLSKTELLALYLQEANRQNSERDKKTAKILQLQFSFFEEAADKGARDETLRKIKNYTNDKDWFVANRAFLLAASGQAIVRNFDIGLRDAQRALNLIPNKLGSDYDEAKYETYDFISYLQLILYNLENGIDTTETVLNKGLETNRQIDGVSLINNMAYAFKKWNEYETAEQLAEILFRLNKRSNQGVNALVYYRYAQAQNNAQNYSGALTTVNDGLKSARNPAHQIGLVSEKAIALAGLSQTMSAKQEFLKFDKIAKDNGLKTGGYAEGRLRARILIARANGDTKTATELQEKRSKTIIQRILRFQNEGIQGLHASLENGKQRQEERAAGLNREANLARNEAEASQRAALFLGLLALAMLGLALLAIRLARSVKAEKDTMEIAKLASEAGDRAKQQFLSVMSHEFRTPLNGIIGIADLLCQQGETETLRSQNKLILDSGEGLLDLLTGILDMTYLESGDLHVYAEAADIRKITAGVFEKLSPKVDSNKVKFTYGVAESVPASLMLDVKRVEQSMRNLVSNAVKFTPNGRIHIHITMEEANAKPGDDENVVQLSIIVADTGIGITDTMKQDLFQPFVQADSSMTRGYGGAGIGLAVTRGFARLMGGDIVVSTRLGSGSEFAFGLKTVDTKLAAREQETGLPMFDCIPHEEHGISFSPATRMDELKERKRIKDEKQEREANARNLQNIIPETAVTLVHEHARLSREKGSVLENQRAGFSRRATRPSDEPVTPDQLRGLNILIVEDVLANQEVVRSLLEPAGCFVSAACNGSEALDLLEDQIFDVILMDIRMPIMDGVETTKAIRKEPGPHQNVPIIALTADASAENNAQCLAAGADVFLTKPVIVSELFASIRFVRENKQRKQNDALSA